MQLRRTLSLYGALHLAGLKAKLNYRADLFVMMASFGLTQGIGYVFLWVIFQQMPNVAGWSLHEVICVYALVFITEGFVALACEGLWSLSWIRHRGDFDVILVRPVSPLLQVMLASVGLSGLSAILIGLAMIGYSLQHVQIEWSAGRIGLALGLFVSAIAVRTASVLISAAIGFWIESPFNPVLPIVHNVSNFARFPLSIYGRAMHLVLTFVIPFGFISYYPAAWLFGKSETAWIGLCTPIVAVVGLVIGVWLFRRGLERYEGSGS
jgi:ABC-2 type transport system permease protein